MNNTTLKKSKPGSRSLNRKSKKLRTLNIPDRLFLLTIDDERGTLSATDKAALGYGLAGAVLAELALANRLRLEEGRLVTIDPSPLGDPLFDQVLGLLASVKKPHKLDRWMEAVGGKGIVRKVAARLVERRVIHVEKKHYRWVIPYAAHPQVNASAKYWVKQQLRTIVLAGGKASASELALLNLVKACRLSRLLFTRDERKFAIRKVEQLATASTKPSPLAELLSGIEAATATAVAAAAS